MSDSSPEGFFRDVCAVIVSQGVGKVRAGILTRQLTANGGATQTRVDGHVTHILVGNNVRLSRVPHLLKVKTLPDNVLVLRADWLSACLMAGEKIGHAQYVVHPEPSPRPSPVKTNHTPSTSPVKVSETNQSETVKDEKKINEPTFSESDRPTTPPLDKSCDTSVTSARDSHDPSTSSMTSPKAGMFRVVERQWKVHLEPNRVKGRWEDVDSDSDYVYSGDEEDAKEETKEETDKGVEQGAERGVAVESETNSPARKKRRWICEIPSSEVKSWVNHNQHITDKLEELLNVYQNSGDKWRAMQTTKAIQSIRKHHTEITSYEEARALPFVGERIANKVHEIISSGHLRRLDTVDQEKEAVLTAFKKIHGVGAVVAHQFYAQGYRTLDELRASGVLNRQQTIGLRHYDDFSERMNREEVAEIEERVKQLCESIAPGMQVVTCGSYRRGKPTCGDIDLLITHPDGRSHRGAFDQLLQRGREEGFFTDDLSIHNDPGGQCKYLGVCQLGEHRKYRRIDIILVPYNEFPLALLHFTGSGHFNRSMRKKADTMGMSLSEHALCSGVIRKKGVKIFDGTPLPVTCEKDVFDYLDMEYKEPTERDHD